MISSSRRWLLPKMGTEYGLLEADEQLPRTISSASLELSQTELLAKLKERLEEIRGADGMAEKSFTPRRPRWIGAISRFLLMVRMNP